MIEKNDRPDITGLLERWGDGDEQARDDVVRAVYEELRAIAHNRLRAEARNRTLDTTGLVHETYLKLVGSGEVPWRSRAHFFAIAARQMRQILVDRARRRCAQKRGGDFDPRTFDESLHYSDDQARTLIEVDQVLTRLAGVHARAAKVVELRFFAGLKAKEIAGAVGASVATVERDWTLARAWLMRELDDLAS